MPIKFFLGSENATEHDLNDYFVELMDGPHSPLYVHVHQAVDGNGLIRTGVSYCPLAEAVGRPFHEQASSLYAASRTRV